MEILVTLSTQCRTNQRMAIDGKSEPHTLILLSALWAAKLRTIDCRGEELTQRVTTPSVSTCFYII